jgi:hypothetical protein
MRQPCLNPPPDLSQLSEAEKDCLILTLWPLAERVQGLMRLVEAQRARIAELEAKLGEPPKGIVKLLGESRGLNELAREQGCCGLCGLLDVADVVPRLESAGPLGAGCRHQVAGQEEEVVDLVVGGEEALSVPG